MRPVRLAFLLAVLSVPAAAASSAGVASSTGTAAEVPGKADLLARIDAWSAQLPPPNAANAFSAVYAPRLARIKAAAKAAATAAALARPRRDLAAWEKSFLRDSYDDDKARGLTTQAFSAYAADRSGSVESAAALSAAFGRARREQAAVSALQGSLVAANADGGAALFDGGAASAGAADATAVSVPPPLDPKDPARYAKVRDILVSEGVSAKIVDAAIQEAIRQGADPLLVLAVVKKESSFNPRATSSAGARGLMQLLPGTARNMGVSNAGLLYNVKTNLRAGIRYLKQLWDQFTDIDMRALSRIDPWSSHDVKAAVAAYNAGPGAVQKYDGVPPYRETRDYVKVVLRYYEQFKGDLGL
ncbi:MAG: lytic transglycosylase domain-containing protein [Elusimicrobia bacterium]|nr:lytic transglycosylase domain-containing protein [Elusimicrobiota bacterium]